MIQSSFVLPATERIMLVRSPLPQTEGSPGLCSRAPSTRAPSAYGSYSSAGSLRRKPTWRRTMGGGGGSSCGGPMNPYEEEEEGYVSGEYEEVYALTKIRVKLHYQDDVRGMTMGPEMPWEEFGGRVAQKFGKGAAPEELMMKFLDEDGGKISLRDDSDFELGIETARELARGRAEGKLQVWVTDA